MSVSDDPLIDEGRQSAGQLLPRCKSQQPEGDLNQLQSETNANAAICDDDIGQTETSGDDIETIDKVVNNEIREMSENNDNLLQSCDVDGNDAEFVADSSSSDDVASFLARLDAGSDEEDVLKGDHENDSDMCNNPAIDTGYAWIICLAVFFIQFLYVGYLKSGGVLFVEFQKRFHSTSSMTSLVIGLEEAVCSIFSFICIGFVLKRTTPRTLCLIGSFFCVFGVAGCALFDRLEFLIFTHSLCFGFSVASSYGTSIVVLNQYFIKRRALAVSISTSGTSVGGIVMPLLLRYLFDTYSYAGGMLMAGGTMMHVFLAVILLIPVEKHRKQAMPQKETPLIETVEDTKVKPRNFHRYILHKLKGRREEDLNSRNASISTNIQHRHPVSHNSNPSVHQSIIPSQAFDQNKFHPNGKGNLIFDSFSSKLEICEEGIPLKIETPAYFDDNATDVPYILTPSPALLSPLNDKIYLSSNGKLNSGVDTNSPFGSCSSQINGSNTSIHLHPDYLTRNRNRVNTFRSGHDADSNVELHEERHQSKRHNNIFSRLSSSRQTLSASLIFRSTSTLHTVADMISADLDILSHATDTTQKSLFQRLQEMCGNNPLLHAISFWFLVMFFFSACIGHSLPQIYIPAIAKERGLSDEDGALFISILNILDIPSHLLPGILVTMGVAKATRICILPMFIVGVVNQLAFLYHSYEALLIMSIMYGAFGGFYYAMQSVIIIEILGMSNFASSIGVFFLVMGGGAAISFPIAGALKDIFGSFSASYHYMATMEFIATLVLIFLPLARKYDCRRGILKEEDNQEDN